MTRRALLLVLAVALAAPVGALAQTVEDRVVRQLQSEGYRNIRATRTLLGRTRILADRDGDEREVIVNRKHQTILRDHIRRAEAEDDDARVRGRRDEDEDEDQQDWDAPDDEDEEEEEEDDDQDDSDEGEDDDDDSDEDDDD